MDVDDDRDVLHYVQSLNLGLPSGQRWAPPTGRDHLHPAVRNSPAGPSHGPPGGSSSFAKLRVVPGADYLDARGASSSRVQQLKDLFPQFDDVILESVYSEAGQDLEDAIALLLELQGEGSGELQAASPAVPSAILTASPASDSEPDGPAAPCSFDDIPQDVKISIFSLFSVKELARIAPVCRDFAAIVRERRSKTPVLVLPPHVALGNPEALVATILAHPSVRKLDVTKCYNSFRTMEDFQTFFEAVALADALRVERQLTMANLNLKALRAAPVMVHIEALDLRGLFALNDNDVQVRFATNSYLDLTLSTMILDSAVSYGMERFSTSTFLGLTHPSFSITREA